jgi:hypothetical protein
MANWDSKLLEMVKTNLPNELAYEVCKVEKLKANTADDFMTKWLDKRHKC